MARIGRELRFRFAKVDRDEFKKRLESSFANLLLDGEQSPWWNLAEELDIDPASIDSLIEVVQEGKWRSSVAPCLYIWQAVQRRTKGQYEDFDSLTGKRAADPEGRTICFSDIAPKPWMIAENIEARGGRRGRDGLFHHAKGWRAELAEGKRLAKLRENSLDSHVGLPDILRAKDSLFNGKSLSDLELAATYFRVLGVPRKEFLDIGGRAMTGRTCSEQEMKAAWRHVHRKGGDDTEMLVIVARAFRVTRDKFLAAARTEEERLERQAAWRRVHHKRTLPALRDTLREHGRAHPRDDDQPDDDYFGTGGGWRTGKAGPDGDDVE